MKRILLLVIIIVLTFNLFGRELIPCRIILNDKTEIEGFSSFPNMLDKTIKFFKNQDSKEIKISNDDISKILFFTDNDTIHYEQVLTYKNYGNKHENKRKSWLKVVIRGYVTLYYGYQQDMNGPAYNMWYYKKEKEKIAYFITMKYSGGIGITVGAKSTLKKNASAYFKDNEELVKKISNSEFKYDDLEQIVKIYNKWIENK